MLSFLADFKASSFLSSSSDFGSGVDVSGVGVDVAEFPESFVASADGVLEDSDGVSDLPDSPAGCVAELDSPDVTGASSLGVTGDDVESLGWVAVESPVGVADGVPDSSE